MTIKEKFEEFIAKKHYGTHYKYVENDKCVAIRGYDDETNLLVEVLKFDKTTKTVTHYSKVTKLHEIKYPIISPNQVEKLINEQVKELGWLND